MITPSFNPSPWLRHEARVKVFIERDRGMYDAVNRGLRRAEGDALAYLNCDEQYLPLIVVHHRLRRPTGGIYFQRPFSYGIYTRESTDRRVSFNVTHPRFRWKTN